MRYLLFLLSFLSTFTFRHPSEFVINNGWIIHFSPEDQFSIFSTEKLGNLKISSASEIILTNVDYNYSETPTPISISSLDAEPTPSRVKSNKQPTRTPRPTATPPEIPPPADPSKANMMIAFSILAVIVVLFGVWINRQRIN